jgi:AbrB family looped-hinge helix DNA binding protein
MRTANLELRDRGQVTLPKALRDALQLETGDAVRAVQIGDSIVLTPQRMELDALRKEVRRLMKKTMSARMICCATRDRSSSGISQQQCVGRDVVGVLIRHELKE